MSVRLLNRKVTAASVFSVTSSQAISTTMPINVQRFGIRVLITVNTGQVDTDGLKLFTNDAENTTNAVEIHNLTQSPITSTTTFTIMDDAMDRQDSALHPYLVLDLTVSNTPDVDVTWEVFYSDNK